MTIGASGAAARGIRGITPSDLTRGRVRKSVSYHEAGHCVAGIAQALRVGALDLNDDGRLGPSLLGYCDFIGIDPETPDVAVLLSLLAGPLAQVRAMGNEPEYRAENTGHVRDVRAVLDALRDEGGVVESVEQLASRARRLLETHWRSVVAIASALAKDGHLNETEIEDIMQRTRSERSRVGAA